ncbi:hypothetical protein ACWGR4_44680 [Embleya sp. NPDC055664]
MAGGVVRKAYEAGAGFAEGRARRPEPVGRLSLEWVPGALLVVLATTGALVLLRAGLDPATPAAPAADPAAYGAAPTPMDAGGGSWSVWDLVAVLLPWAVPLVIGGIGLTDSVFTHRRGAVGGVLTIGLAGAALTTALDPIAAHYDGSHARWLGFVYLLRFGFAVQVLVGVVLWIHLAVPRHQAPLNAAFAGTLAAAVPLLFVLGGRDVLEPMWESGAGLQTWLPLAAFAWLLILLPTGRVLVPPGRGWQESEGGAQGGVFLLGLAGVGVAAATVVMGDDKPRVLGLWPVVALAGCLVAAVLTYRVDGVRSVAGALLAMAVGLAAFPAALFAWDRTQANPGLGLDGPGEYVPWLLGLVVAGVVGAVAARLFGAYAIGLAALALVLAEFIGPAAGSGHQLAVRCAGAAAIGVVIGGLRPEAAIAAFGLGAACGPVWPDLQAASADYGWVEWLTKKPGGVPLPLLVLAAIALPLAMFAGMRGTPAPPPPRRPGPGPGPVGAPVGGGGPWAPNAYAESAPQPYLPQQPGGYGQPHALHQPGGYDQPAGPTPQSGADGYLPQQPGAGTPHHPQSPGLPNLGPGPVRRDLNRTDGPDT